MTSAFRRNPFTGRITEEEKEGLGFLNWNPGDDFLNWLGNIFTSSHTDAVTKYAQKSVAEPMKAEKPRIDPNAAETFISARMKPWIGLAQMAQRAAERQKSDSGLNDILENLQSLMDPSRYAVDPGQLEAQARASASAQYDPIINNLRQQMSSTEERGNRNRQIIGDLYGQLASQTKSDIPVQERMYREARKGTSSEYDELESQIKQQYAQSQKEQEDMMKRLNIEAAASDILPEQQRDRDFFLNTARKDERYLQDALGQEERGAIDFTREGAQIARAEGTQAQADLLMQLEQMLQGYQNQISSQEAAKNQAYLSALGDLQGSASSSAAEQAQNEFNNYLKMIELQRTLRGDRLSEEQNRFDNSLEIFNLLAPQGDDQRMQILRTLANIGDQRAIDELAKMLEGGTGSSGISQQQLQQMRLMGLLR